MTAREFYDVVVLMRLNMKKYLELTAKMKEHGLSDIEHERRKKYLENYNNFTHVIDDCIERVQAILKKEQEEKEKK